MAHGLVATSPASTDLAGMLTLPRAQAPLYNGVSLFYLLRIQQAALHQRLLRLLSIAHRHDARRPRSHT